MVAGVKAFLVRIIGITIILGGTASAGDAKDASQPAAVPLCSVESTLEEMQQEHRDWVAATLRGDQGEAGAHERALFAALWLDLRSTEERVRQLAKDVALSQDSLTAGGRVVADETQSRFQYELRNLKAKKTLSKSLQRTDAFSNKYRLMGDYIYLLRKELGMRPPDLASVPGEKEQETTGGTTAK